MSKVNYATETKRKFAPPSTKRTSREPLNGRHLARVSQIEPRTFSTGSFGLKVVYTVEGGEGAGQNVYSNFIMYKGDNTPIEWAAKNGKPAKTLAQRQDDFLLNHGYEAGTDEFTWPSNDQDFGDIKALIGKPVVLILDSNSETYMGKPRTNVLAVYPQD